MGKVEKVYWIIGLHSFFEQKPTLLNILYVSSDFCHNFLVLLESSIE